MTELTLKNVSLDYPLFGSRHRSMRSHFVDALSGRKTTAASFRALKNVTLSLRPNSRTALIGRNGAGKSTLLRTMAGIYKPTDGEVLRSGSLATLFDLGLAFNPQATGIENIKLAGLMRGLSLTEINSILPEVIEFADIGDFIFEPVSTYSSGMQVRLAFSVAIYIKADLLLIDEIFGAGDHNFRQKAQKKLNEWVDASSIFLLASHNFNLLKNNCTDAIWMENGKILEHGPLEKTFKSYTSHIG